MLIRSNVKAGGTQLQHNEKLTGDKKTKSLVVKTGIKAGPDPTPIIRGWAEKSSHYLDQGREPQRQKEHEGLDVNNYLCIFVVASE